MAKQVFWYDRLRFFCKAFNLLLVMALFAANTVAQVAINTDGSAPNNSAQLDIKSTNKGLLIPRIANPSAAVSTPAEGLLLYNSTARQPSFFNGSAWVGMGAGLISRFPRSIGIQGNFPTTSPNQTTSTWTVPAGLSEIWVELWAAGDAGNGLSGATIPGETTSSPGGDAGDYASILLPVTPGAIVTINAGNSGSVTFAGGNSSVNIGANTYEVRQRSFGIYTNNSITIQVPGLLMFVAGGYGLRGSQTFIQASATDFRRIIYCGNGGSAYPTQAGGEGITLAYNAATGSIIPSGLISIPGNAGTSPGGGGGGSLGNGGQGGAGLVIVHY